MMRQQNRTTVAYHAPGFVFYVVVDQPGIWTIKTGASTSGM